MLDDTYDQTAQKEKGQDMSDLLRTPLYGLHKELGGKMVAFAGYKMPVQYPSGIMQEHIHTREKAGLFDVSHMGQVVIKGQKYDSAALALETLIPIDILTLGENRQRYGFLTNAEGGILDDLMLANRGDHIFMVLNAACKAADLAHMRQFLHNVTLTEQTDRALLALQGPAAESVLSALDPKAARMRFMDVADLILDGAACVVSRSGYTGEDGYEISVPAAQAEKLARVFLAHEDVAPIGLGARDSLRLEAGLCLYGHDIDTRTTPVSAQLNWAIQKIRRADGARAGGFLGAETILSELQNGSAQKRVGLIPHGRAPMRENVELFSDESSATPIGRITSGGFGPSVQKPIAMGYVNAQYAAQGTTLYGQLRGKRLALSVSALPFTPSNFKR